jgi:O-antigen ligase
MQGLSLFNLCIYLLLLAWCYTIMTKKRLFESNSVNKYIILLSFVVLVSTVIKLVLGEIPNINMRTELVSFKRWANPLILFFILFNIVDDEKTAKGTVLGLIILLAVAALTTPLISLGIIKIGHLSKLFEGRAAAFGGPNSFSSYLVMFIPLVLTYLLFQKTFILRAASAVLLALTFAGLITTASRGGLLSFLVGMAAYLYILYRQRMIQLPTIIALIVTVLIIGSISFVLAPSEPKSILLDRLDTSRLEEGECLDKYTAGRTLLLRKGIQLFFESPIYGHGQNSFLPLVEKKFGIHGVAHNAYLSYLVEYGIWGLIFFVMILKKIFQHVWKQIKETSHVWDKLLYISYIAGFCGYHFSLLAQNESQPRYIFWIYTAVILKYDKIRND